MPTKHIYVMVLFKNVKIEPRQKMVKIDCSTGVRPTYSHSHKVTAAKYLNAAA